MVRRKHSIPNVITMLLRVGVSDDHQAEYLIGWTARCNHSEDELIAFHDELERLTTAKRLT